jgi:hypothetical protein
MLVDATISGDKYDQKEAEKILKCEDFGIEI